MSCIPAERRFRLLDRIVGWDAAGVEHLAGLDEAAGMRLAGDPAALSEIDVDPFIAPPVLAPACGECDWFLATPPWPEPRLLRLSGCSNSWTSAWDRDRAPVRFAEIAAVAFDRNLLAIADKAAGRILVLMAQGWRIIGEAQLPDPVDLSFGPRDTLAVACGGGNRIEIVATSGGPLGHWPAPLPAGRILRLAHDRKARLWLLIRRVDGRLALYRQADLTGSFVADDLAGLAAAFARTALIGSGLAGFTMLRGTAGGSEGAISWDWAGRQLTGALGGTGAGQLAPDRFARQGQFLTLAIDSGVERCRWHRVRIDADVPPRTAIEIAIATNDRPNPPAQGVAGGDWAAFAPGLPHPGDWQVVEPGAMDALVRQPVGRYLFLRLRLTGDGQSTPHVRRIHLDLPRATSADLLPAIYREEPRSADFTERFLALFDAGLETIDQCIARLPAALAAGSTDAELLPWLAEILGIGLDPAWDIAARRRLLGAAPELFRKRGTPAGLRMAVELVADNGRPAGGALIEEHGLLRSWGAVAAAGGSGNASDARLGVTRLFSRAATRMRLGASPIGGAPVLSYGNAEEDPLETGAFRFSVALPFDVPISTESLFALVDSQKPAHTLAAVRKGVAGGFVVTGLGRLGIDTQVREPEPAVIGDRSVRLGTNSVVGGSLPRGVVLANPGGTASPSSRAGSMCE